jgi:hypothetical protein
MYVIPVYFNDLDLLKEIKKEENYRKYSKWNDRSIILSAKSIDMVKYLIEIGCEIDKEVFKN